MRGFLGELGGLLLGVGDEGLGAGAGGAEFVVELLPRGGAGAQLGVSLKHLGVAVIPVELGLQPQGVGAQGVAGGLGGVAGGGGGVGCRLGGVALGLQKARAGAGFDELGLQLAEARALRILRRGLRGAGLAAASFGRKPFRDDARRGVGNQGQNLHTVSVRSLRCAAGAPSAAKLR